MTYSQTNQRKSIYSFMANLTEELSTKAPVFTGNLAKSIESTFKEEDSNFDIDVTALNYASFMDLGVNGIEKSQGSPYTFKKKPPIAALEPLAKSLGISPYALQNSIYKNGIRGTGFITKNIDDNLEAFADDFSNQVWEDYANDNKQKTNKK